MASRDELDFIESETFGLAHSFAKCTRMPCLLPVAVKYTLCSSVSGSVVSCAPRMIHLAQLL